MVIVTKEPAQDGPGATRATQRASGFLPDLVARSRALCAIENKLPDVALIRAARSGDRVAFGRLYEQYGRLVHGILLAHVAYDQAEDLMQDVFVKAMQQLPALRDPAAFCSW